MSKKYHLFEVVGIELEYMLIDKTTFKVTPTVDNLLTQKNGSFTSDVENGDIAWSNELVAHVVELKTNGPVKSLLKLSDAFHTNVIEISTLLDENSQKILPTACHPLMNPLTDTQLWKHSYSEVYQLYNKIFGCQGHGWSNVQSMHINLPFFNESEFEKLHAAIRILLPILPGLCASSPIIEGKKTGFLDTRLEYYKNNQKQIPVLTGHVIPERVFSKADYYSTIFEPIKKAILPYDDEKVLDHHFLNSRGAIARFDRNAIEIRVIDIQECPLADISIAALIIEVLKLLVNNELASLNQQKKWNEEALFLIFNDTIKEAENTLVTNLDYLSLFDLQSPKNVNEIWTHLYNLVEDKLPKQYKQTIEIILTNGSLASRILKACNNNFSDKNIVSVYNQLSQCLKDNKVFIP